MAGSSVAGSSREGASFSGPGGAGPTVKVDLDKVEANARVITGFCAEHGISVTAVSKVTCGMPQVAKALLRGGAAGIGESRLENVHRLRANGIVAEMMLLRIPPLSGIDEIVRSVDVSLNSELSVIRSLSQAAREHGITHKIIIMIDLGDLREGFWPDDVLKAAREIVELPNLKLQGVGTNLTCYGGVIPTRENMQNLVDWAHRIEDVTGVRMQTISGGNTSSLPLLAAGRMPKEVNHLRIGEGILLGRETIKRTAWPGTFQDAFRLEAEVIELKEKPSVPIGETGQDAFGHTPVFENKGEMLRGIFNLGREDVDVDGLFPVDERLSILGASSDHLLLDVSPMATELQVGDTVEFNMNYSALLAAMTSNYVGKYSVSKRDELKKSTEIAFFGNALETNPESAFVRSLKSIGYSLRSEVAASREDEDLQESLETFIRNQGFPILYGKKSLTVEGFTALNRAVQGAGMLWISPHASITKTYSERDDLGRLLRSLPLDDLEDLKVLQETSNDEAASSAGRQAEGDVEDLILGVDNLILVGMREADPKEAEIIRRLGITVYTMEDVDQMGIQAVMRKALQRAVIGTQGLYVHYDPQICDGGQEGLTIRETHLMLELIARTGFMRALDVSGFHVAGRERRSLQNFVASALGKRILG